MSFTFDDPRLPERFWSRVVPEPNTGCWLWIGSVSGTEHAKLRWEGRTKMAYRLSYETLVAVIPPGLVVDHLCRVPRCVNPHHLEPVTPSVNVLRGDIGKMRGSVGHWLANKPTCPAGHPFDESNTRVRPSGHRECRECRRARWRAEREAAGVAVGHIAGVQPRMTEAQIAEMLERRSRGESLRSMAPIFGVAPSTVSLTYLRVTAALDARKGEP